MKVTRVAAMTWASGWGGGWGYAAPLLFSYRIWIALSHEIQAVLARHAVEPQGSGFR